MTSPAGAAAGSHAATRVILEMRNITKTFPGVIALRDVSFSVEEGEIHALCGENGAGKSTLMKVLSG
ncbi:ATP-binding cassette domain-containing protein, partial [Pleomorphomonas carboxyditropha]